MTPDQQLIVLTKTQYNTRPSFNYFFIAHERGCIALASRVYAATALRATAVERGGPEWAAPKPSPQVAARELVSSRRRCTENASSVAQSAERVRRADRVAKLRTVFRGGDCV